MFNDVELFIEMSIKFIIILTDIDNRVSLFTVGEQIGVTKVTVDSGGQEIEVSAICSATYTASVSSLSLSYLKHYQSTHATLLKLYRS